MPLTQKEANQLNEAKAKVLAQWREACFIQGVPADSEFVVFANTNEAANEHNRLMGKFLKLVIDCWETHVAQRERHAAMKDLGLKRVKGSAGGTCAGRKEDTALRRKRNGRRGNLSAPCLSPG